MPQQEKPPQREAAHHKEENTPLAATRESLHAAMKTQCSQKINEKLKNIYIKKNLAKKRKSSQGTSLVVNCVRLGAPNAEGLGSIPSQGSRSHRHATMKIHVLHVPQ